MKFPEREIKFHFGPGWNLTWPKKKRGGEIFFLAFFVSKFQVWHFVEFAVIWIERWYRFQALWMRGCGDNGTLNFLISQKRAKNKIFQTFPPPPFFKALSRFYGGAPEISIHWKRIWCGKVLSSKSFFPSRDKRERIPFVKSENIISLSGQLWKYYLIVD